VVNLDTNTGFALVSEGSWVRRQIKAHLQGKQSVMTETALQEFQGILATMGGPSEQARAARFLSKISVVPDNPSARARRLRPTKHLEQNDIIILGTGDEMGVITLTSDREAVRVARVQGVHFQVVLHPPFPLTGT
jgi:hypothetical protein